MKNSASKPKTVTSAGSAPQPAPCRPAIYSAEKAAQLLAALRGCGSFRVACASVGLSEALVYRWKQPTHDDGSPNECYREDFAEAVEQALAEFKLDRIAVIVQGAPAKDGHDWKADVWLLERLFGADYAAPKAVEAAAVAAASASVSIEVRVSEEDLARMQQRRRELLQGGQN